MTVDEMLFFTYDFSEHFSNGPFEMGSSGKMRASDFAALAARWARWLCDFSKHAQ
jgi:hypothetical protein